MNFPRKIKWYIVVLIIVLTLGFIFKTSILKLSGSLLIVEDEISQADVIYVLGGNAKDRGAKAAELFHSNFAKEIVCIGGNWHDVLEEYGITTLESEVTKKVIENRGVPSDKIRLIKHSTSTFEEKSHILKDIQEKGYKSVIIVSDKFHTRRIDGLFRDDLEDKNIRLILIGANNSDYNESDWWKTEKGLIMLNNEYIKNVFYLFKY